MLLTIRGQASLHPLSSFLAPFCGGGMPALSQLNAAARQRGIKSGGGAAICFVAANDGPLRQEGLSALSYEARIFHTGAVATRLANWHDAFNALIWLHFPHTKALLNRQHIQALSMADAASASPPRGPVRDALTQFDECGVVVVGTQPALWGAICAHRWQEAFVAQRAELQQTTRFIVFGHASHEALMAPFYGLCGKALFLPVDAGALASIDTAGVARLDESLARRLASADYLLRSPRDLQPLPLLGIPGATTDNENPDYYADTRQFRPARTMRVGSSPGSR
jgi:hypothetical protein